MRRPRFRVRTLMILVWLFALLCVAAADVVNELRARNRVVVVDQRVYPDGSSSSTLLWQHTTHHYFGPFPLGPCPLAALSGVAFVGSVLAWAILSQRGRRSGQT